MELDSLDLALYAILAGASTLAAVIAARRVCASLLDYWVAIPVQQALVLAYAWYAWSNDLVTDLQFWYVAAGLVAFAVGTRALPATFERPPPSEPSGELASLFRHVLYSLCVYQAITDTVYVVATGGIPAFMPGGIHPNMYVGGFGFVKYIHDANVAALPALSFVLAIFWKDYRALAAGLLFSAYPQVLMEWSKTAVLGLPLLFLTVNRYCGERFGRRLVVPKKILLAAAPLAVAFVLYKFAEVVAQGYESSIALAVLKRVVNTADAVFMYFQLDGHAYFEGDVGLVSWLFSHVTPYLGLPNPTAAEFGVLLAQYTLGIGEAGYGAYPPFQIVGHLTMGFAGGLGYAFAVGVALAWIRRKTVSLPWLPVYLVVFNAALFLAGDSSLFAYSLFCHVATLPAYVVGVVLHATAAGRGAGARGAESEALGTVRT